MIEERKEQPAGDNRAGIQPETGSILDRADSIAKRLEESNKRAEELIAKQERAIAENILAGKSNAGTPAPQISHEQEVRDRVNKMLEKTGMHI